jgi:hypothetical protein
MNAMIGKRICWVWRGTVRHGVVVSVIGTGMDEAYIVNAADGGRAIVPCCMTHSVS